MPGVGFLSSKGLEDSPMSRKPTIEELEQRIKELESLESESKKDDMMLQYLFDLSIDMLCVADITDGCFKLINKASEKTLGYTKEELLKEPFLNFVHPDDRRSTVSAVENLSKGAPAINFDNRYRCKDNTYKWLSWTSMPFPDQGLTFAVARDITDRKKAEEELKKHRDRLEELVTERTKDLKKSNQELRAEIADRKQAEKALRESEERFYNLFDLSPQAIAVSELETGKLIDVNKIFCEVTKYTKDQLLGKTTTELGFYSDDDRIQFKKELETSGEVFGLEMNFKLKDASTIHTLVFAKLIGITGKNLIITVLHDLTERKQAEVALQKSEERYRQLANLLPQVVYEADEKGNLTFANRIAFDLFGYTEDDFAEGLTAFDMIVAEERDRAVENFRKMLDGEKSVGTEYTALKKNGSTFPSLIYASAIISEGKPVGLRGIIVDLTEFKRAHKALRETEEKYKELVENANSIILKMDTQGKITFFNEFAQNFFGYSEKDIIGSNVVGTIVPSIDSAGNDLSAMIADIGNHPELYANNENENILKNGLHVWVAWTNKPILDEKGNITEILCIGNDITEQKQAEERRKNLEAQLQQAHKMDAIGTLAGGIAHEFNNLLGIIVGNTELAMPVVPEHNTAHHNLEEIRTASLRARDVVRQLLSFSRKTKEELKPVSLVPIVKDSLKLIRSSIPTTIEIRQDISAVSDTIKADLTQINQIIINLCTNAAHAMQDKGGVLRVGLENVVLGEDDASNYHGLTPGSYIRLIVSDTGCGIVPELTAHIFDPFFTTKEVGKGTGMGLSVVHGIIKKYGGKITFQSEPDKGTTFYVLFPVIKDEVEAEIEPSEIIEEGSERILFVDDEESLVIAAKDYLEDFGYQVITEINPVKALGIFKEDPEGFDLIITDMTMSDLTGDMLAKKIMSIRPDMPVILCTGYSEKISEVEAKGMGIKAFVMKPALVEEMATTIRLVLDQGKGENVSVAKRILVVDDEEQMRSILRQIMESAGYEVSEAPDGRVALGLCRKKQFDLIITDLIMPEKEGIETIIELKRGFPKVKIIAISGGGRGAPETYLDIAKDIGADHTLAKPFDKEEILKIVKELLA